MDFNATMLSDVSNPRFKRSLSILRAIDLNCDICLKYIKSVRTDSGREYELIVVDFECDGVPDANNAGVLYREELGIAVSEDKSVVPEVWALRLEFPDLMHMSVPEKGMPKILCLYNESRYSINRTWTAQNFLQKIYWWIESSANGEIHDKFQSLEQFFFNSSYDLILPKNFEFNSKKNFDDFLQALLIPRSDNSGTIVLDEVSESKGKGTEVDVICFEFPVVEHGKIHSLPLDLFSLFELTQDLMPSEKSFLHTLLAEKMPEEGIEHSNNDKKTVILVKIPLKRTKLDLAEKTTWQAFFVPDNYVKIGIRLGVYVKNPNDERVYLFNSIGGTNIAPENIDLYPIEVGQFNNVQDHQQQSGGSENKKKYTIVGLGSLGGVLVELWNRSGWGEWLLIDKDYIKPHNLTRHIAGVNHIGAPKSWACLQSMAQNTDNIENYEYKFEDAMNLSEDTKMILQKSELVVDVSTTLEYPRFISDVKSYPRHCSIFLTPDGNGAVILLEDMIRNISLRAIEAQYYHYLINQELGKTHLTNSPNTFVSGSSCRDISLELPFSKVTVFGALLSEQIEALSERGDAVGRVWQKNLETGSIEMFEITVSEEIEFKFGEQRVFVSEAVVSKIKNYRLRELPKETGGILLGYHDFNIGAVVIVDALAAAKDSLNSINYFERGIEGVPENVAEAYRRTTGVVTYVGEWHSHPKNIKGKQSKMDKIQLKELSKISNEDGLVAVQLIVGSDGINVYLGGK